MKDSPNLDLLRTCAVVFVVISHLPHFQWFETMPGGYSPNTLGQLGVSLFFVHTALVLMLSLERRGSSAAAFLIRRIMRIYPLSVATVLVMLALSMLSGTAVDGWQVLTNLLLIQNLTGHASSPPPLWTLPYEMQMYLFLPALYGVTLLARPARRIAAVWAGSVALALAAMQTNTDLYDVVKLLPCFLPGVLAFTLRSRVKHNSPALLFALIVVGGIAIPMVLPKSSPLVPPMMWAVCLVLGVVIPTCRQIENSAIAKGAKLVATYSYGIYLTHLLAIVVGFFLGAGLPLVVRFSVFLSVLIALSMAAYRWVEQPGIRLGARLADNLARSRRTNEKTTPTVKAGAV